MEVAFSGKASAVRFHSSLPSARFFVRRHSVLGKILLFLIPHPFIQRGTGGGPAFVRLTVTREIGQVRLLLIADFDQRQRKRIDDRE